MIGNVIIYTGAAVAGYAMVALLLVWLAPRAAVTRAVAPAGRGLQPSRANRALASLVLGLLGAQLALSQAGFERSAFFVMGALYPLIGMVLYRIRYRC